MKNILAMILAGGRVDELDVLTFERPKSTMPFGALYRIIDFPYVKPHSLRHREGRHLLSVPALASHGSCGQRKPVGHGGPQPLCRDTATLQGPRAADWYKGTADAVYQNLEFVRMRNPDLVIILSGDHVYRMDYQQMAAFHLEKEADLTIGFTRMPKKGPTGSVRH